jgi:hypothetical protein
MRYQILTLIIGILAVVVYKGVAIHHTYSDFGAELDFSLCLTTDYRTHMRLEDTHYTVTASLQT